MTELSTNSDLVIDNSYKVTAAGVLLNVMIQNRSLELSVFINSDWSFYPSMTMI